MEGFPEGFGEHGWEEPRWRRGGRETEGRGRRG